MIVFLVAIPRGIDLGLPRNYYFAQPALGFTLLKLKQVFGAVAGEIDGQGAITSFEVFGICNSLEDR